MIRIELPVFFISGDVSLQQNFLPIFNNVLVLNIQPDSFYNHFIENAIDYTGNKIEQIGGSIEWPK